MFVTFTKTLKKMSGFRLGFGMRINKKNAVFVLFAMLFVWIFQLMWYMVVGAGWLLYFMLYGIYKIYYFMFKYCAIGIKKLYGVIVRKKDVPAADETPATEAAKPAGAKEEPAPAPELPYEFLKMKVAGVTFKDGRQSRQTMIRRLYWKDAPFDENEAEVTLQREEFEGKPAFAVLLNDRKIGYIPAEHAQFVADNFERCDGVTHIEASCGKDDVYGAEIIIRFRKV